MTKEGPVTQSDIAAKLKVSRITVSKALRDHPDISRVMKEKVSFNDRQGTSDAMNSLL